MVMTQLRNTSKKDYQPLSCTGWGKSRVVAENVSFNASLYVQPVAALLVLHVKKAFPQPHFIRVPSFLRTSRVRERL